MQTRWQSMVEAFLNTLTGYIISVVAQVLIFPHYGIHLGLCGAQPFDMGGSYPSAAATGCHECRRCRAMLDNVFPPPKV